jgi:hypothetical protein
MWLQRVIQSDILIPTLFNVAHDTTAVGFEQAQFESKADLSRANT